MDRDESLEISESVKSLELSVFDRQLVGKHESIGSAQIKLDQKLFSETPIRDILLPLSPRGAVHIRISMEGGGKHDVAYHLSTASRALDRAAADMQRDIVDRLAEYAKVTLSIGTILGLTKASKDKKKGKTVAGPTEEDLESSLGSLCEYLNANVRLAAFFYIRLNNAVLRLLRDIAS